MLATALLAGILVQACGSGQAPDAPTESDSTPAADSIGEALFLETRFAEFFAANMTSVNAPLAAGDPVVNQVQTLNGPLPGPFAGQSINCRSCHFVTEFEGVSGGGNRTYSDFTTRSPIPLSQPQPNGFNLTPRNAMQMVDSFTSRSGPLFLHFDGEFASGQDLVIGTMTGRNFGWLPTQYNQAIAHIALVIRENNGSGQLAADRLNGLSYSVIFKGTDSRIPSSLQLPPSQRLDVSTATDAQVVNEIAICITQYMEDLLFQRDSFGRYIGSPYDNFLRVNDLPQQPLAGETKAAYNLRLYQQVLALQNPIYITAADGSYKYHAQPYQFGASELQGLKIFLASATAGATNAHAGNCAACHQAPDFSDFVFHNNGVSQAEYDAAQGSGAFMNLLVPGNTQRLANYNAYLPATANHPDMLASPSAMRSRRGQPRLCGPRTLEHLSQPRLPKSTDEPLIRRLRRHQLFRRQRSRLDDRSIQNASPARPGRLGTLLPQRQRTQVRRRHQPLHHDVRSRAFRSDAQCPSRVRQHVSQSG